MKYLLIATLLFYVLTYWSANCEDRPGEGGFDVVISFIICAAVSTLLTIVYGALVFWNGRFW